MRLLHHILLQVLLCSCLSTQSQSFDLANLAAGKKDISSFTSIFADTTGQLEIEALESATFNSFTDYPSDRFQQLPSKTNCWLKINFQNNTIDK